jgi:hypothetical protein
MHEGRAKATPPKDEWRWQRILHAPTPRGRLWGKLEKKAAVLSQTTDARLIKQTCKIWARLPEAPGAAEKRDKLGGGIGVCDEQISSGIRVQGGNKGLGQRHRGV